MSDNGPPPPLDDVDRLIVRELSRDGRATSTDLAALAGLSKAAVASRVRRLIETDVVRVTAVFDVNAAGYQWQVNCFIRSSGVGADVVAKTLAALEPTWASSVVLGRFDVVAVFIFEDQANLAAFFADQLPMVEGVGLYECDITVKPLWYVPFTSNMMARATVDPDSLETPIRLPNPVVDLDGTDEQIIALLRADGRQSNRQIGKYLGVSEGTVRARIKRLQDANLMRIVAWIDPRALGQTRHPLWLRLRSDGATPDSIALEMSNIPQLATVSATVGSATIISTGVAEDRREIHEIVSAIRDVSGVADVEVYEVIEVHTYGSHLVRIPETSSRARKDYSTID